MSQRGEGALAQEPLELMDRALNKLGREKGTEPGWPVMSNGMECQNWRNKKLEGALSVFDEVLAQCTTPELFLH